MDDKRIYVLKDDAFIQELENNPRVKKLQAQNFHSLFKLDSKSQVSKNSINNIVLILEKDEQFKGVFQYNEFSQEIVVTKDIPNTGIKKGPLEDYVIDKIASLIEANPSYDCVLFDSKNIIKAIGIVSHKQSFNPVVDYLKDAYKNWDHKKRLENIFTTYLGAENIEVNRVIAIHFFANAVAQVFEPGRKNDEVLDLVGRQGTGKTEFLRRIAPKDLYTDDFTSFDQRDDLDRFRSAMIINDDELAVSGSKKSSFEEVKKFASKRKLVFRSAYARLAKTYPRRWSFARTTNNLFYLNDITGNRRFMPVLARKGQAAKSVFSITEKDKKQIWGEAMAFYYKDLSERKTNPDFKGILTFSPEQASLVLKAQKQFTNSSSIEDEIDMLVNVTKFSQNNFITSYELARELNLDPVRDNKQMAKVKAIMINKMGFKYNRNEKRQHGYERIMPKVAQG